MPECVVCEQEWFIIGIDTDDYGAKRGGQTLAEAKNRWGALPPTYTSTSRDDGVSKIRLYRIPKGIRLCGNIIFAELGFGDIDIIQPHHRYLVCWPSIHPETGNVYRWSGLNGEMMDGPPPVWEIPELPEPWLEALKEQSKTKANSSGSRTEGTAWEECPYIIEQCLTDGEMSEKVAKRLGEATSHCHGGSRHDQVLKDSLALLRYGRRGESGVFEAMSALMKTFVNAVTADGSRTKVEAQDEFMRMLSNRGAAERLSEPDDDEPPPYGSIDGAALLDEIDDYLSQYVIYPNEYTTRAHTLWVAHAHLMDCWESTPRIAFLSPEPGSGKTRALEVTEPLVPRPVHSVNVTPAYLFRKISDPAGLPTILYDEVDTVFGFGRGKDNEEVRGVINAGHRIRATSGRCTTRGDNIVTEELPAYCAVAMAGLNDLPATIMSRTIVVRMQKRAPSETVKPWRHRVDAPIGHAIAERLADWADSAREHAKQHWPEMPAGIEDRDADAWEALLAIADLAGGHWPKTARVAAVALVADTRRRPPTIGVQLLGDIKAVFLAKDNPDHLMTAELLNRLERMEESRWRTIKRDGKAIDARYLASQLSRYGVTSCDIRDGDGVHKGYYWAEFEDAWERYLPDEDEPQDGSITVATTSTPVHHESATSATSATPVHNGTEFVADGVARNPRSGSMSREHSDRYSPVNF
jgi:Protein of unknown function (DUF3631)/Bifunctional DNA primase/polymerase, N-terminal